MGARTKIVVVGASGHSRVVCNVVASNDHFHIVGLLDKVKEAGEMVGDYEVLGSEASLLNIRERSYFDGVIIAVGDNFTRARILRSIVELCPSLRLITANHPAAFVADSAKIGAGTVIMPGAMINPGAVIGCNCIINTGAIVEHDVIIEAHASLGPGCVIGGGSVVGEYSAIGIGSTILHNISIGSHTVVGAGSVVTGDLGSNVVAYGVPARSIRDRVSGERYL